MRRGLDGATNKTRLYSNRVADVCVSASCDAFAVGHPTRVSVCVRPAAMRSSFSPQLSVIVKACFSIQKSALELQGICGSIACVRAARVCCLGFYFNMKW